MKPRTKEFLQKLADLMEEYDAKMEVVSDRYDYETVVTGIDIDLDNKKSGDDWFWDYVTIKPYSTHEEIRAVILEEEGK